MHHRNEEYAYLLYHLTKGKKGKALQDAVQVFALYLKKHQALGRIKEIEEALIAFEKKEQGHITATIDSHYPLDATTIKKIENAFDGNITYTERIDESLLGGIVITTDTHRFDGSIKTQLALLNEQLSHI